jgi:hypothetical protein
MTVTEPARILRLPRDKHDRPVPWFVAWIEGQPDFRVIRRGGIHDALTGNLCWICGRPRKPRSVSAFVIGPMCAINRVAPEPPSHPDCAVFAARACPFLANPAMRRRETGLPADMVAPGGVSILRNPGVALVWHTHRWTVEDVGNGLLWFLGDPERVGWYAHGRDATRAEVLASIESGLPILRAEAEREGSDALTELEQQTAAAMGLLPEE